MMSQVERQLLEETRDGVKDIAVRLARIEERDGTRSKHIDGLEARVSVLEEKVTRLTVIASVGGGLVGALLGAGLKALSR